MHFETRQDWQVTPREAVQIQKALAGQVVTVGVVAAPCLIAGVDVSVNRTEGSGTGAVVVLSYPGLEVVESRAVAGPVTFPYVPGLLSFREIPLLLRAFEEIALTPDLVLVDGQGYAHPRRMGIASHLGLVLGIPTIGCAKSRLCGAYAEPGRERGKYAGLFDDNGEQIGAAVRTRTATKPVFVSIGHRISLEQAIFWTLQCCRGYRLPEPTRQAHIAANSRAIAV
jgi:deoxyribonuclease V